MTGSLNDTSFLTTHLNNLRIVKKYIMIKANKTFTINFPTITKALPQRTFVRTGTYGDGNCFIHALLRAIDTGYRRQSSYSLHLKLVERFRRDITEWITPEIVKGLGNGEPLRLGFLTEFNHLLEQNYTTLSDHPSPVIRVLYQLVPKQEMDEHIIPHVLKQENFYIAFCEQVEKNIRPKLKNVQPEKVENLCKQIHEHFIHLFQEAYKQAIDKFKNKFSRMGEYVDSTQMDCISQYTGYNFIFIQYEKDTAYPGQTHMVTFDKNLKCLIFLWIDENHFEIIGELEDRNMINRIFDANDPLIELLSDPDNLSPLSNS
jgi:hypothetical protein